MGHEKWFAADVTGPSPTVWEAGVRAVAFGEDVTVVMPSNLYECSIGDRSFIGPFVEIQKGVQVGSDCRIQSHTFVCELVTIGKQVFVGHGVTFINDLLRDGPAGGDRTKWKETVIGDNVSIGSNCTVLPVRIAPGCVIGAGSVVTRDCERPKGLYVGNPARWVRDIDG